MPENVERLDEGRVASVIWQQCWNINVFGKTFRLCLRIILDGSTFYLEIEAAGKTVRIALTNTCVTVFTLFGLIDIEVCLSDIQISGGHLKSLCIEVKACAPLAGCITIVKVCPHFALIADPAFAHARGWHTALVPIESHVTEVDL